MYNYAYHLTRCQNQCQNNISMFMNVRLSIVWEFKMIWDMGFTIFNRWMASNLCFDIEVLLLSSIISLILCNATFSMLHNYSIFMAERSRDEYQKETTFHILDSRRESMSSEQHDKWAAFLHKYIQTPDKKSQQRKVHIFLIHKIHHFPTGNRQQKRPYNRH